MQVEWKMEEEESDADENWREKLRNLVEKSVQGLKQLQSSVHCLQLNPTDQDDIIVTLQVGNAECNINILLRVYMEYRFVKLANV